MDLTKEWAVTPSKRLKSGILAGLMLLAFSGHAKTATLTDDFVMVNYNDSILTKSNGNGSVGVGTDITIRGGLFDFNAGPGGNQFNFSVNKKFCGVAHCGGAIKLSLLDLNFSNGERLTEFTLLSTALKGLSFTFTNTSLVFLATEGKIKKGTVISGIFLTAPPPGPVNGNPVVPLPAALPLFGSAIGVFVWTRRQRKVI